MKEVSKQKGTLPGCAALVCREPNRLEIDLAALSETRIPKKVNLNRVVLLPIQCETSRRRARTGCGNCINVKLHPAVVSCDAVSTRILSIRLLLKKTYSTIIRDEAKLAFYEDLTHTIESIPRGDFLILVWVFNAWVGRVHVAWPRVIGKYDLCKI